MRQLGCKLIIILLSVLSRSAAASEHLMPVTGMEACDRSSKIEQIKLSDNDGVSFDVFWSDHAGVNCPGSGFPRIVVAHNKVRYWVQIIEVDWPYKYFVSEFNGWMHQLSSNSNKWILLDVSDAHRSAKVPFYNVSGSYVFHDNPLWGPIAQGSPFHTRRWVASLYGFETPEMRDPVVQLEWGFKQTRGKPIPDAIRPRRGKTEALLLVKERSLLK